jgi:hypothetical protein
LHWVGFGAVAIFAAWLPLAYAAQALAARSLSARFGPDASREDVAGRIAAMPWGERAALVVTQALPHALALAIAAFAGGFLTGRFSPRARGREAAMAGAATATVAALVSCRSSYDAFASLVTLAIATLFAAWGGRTGALRKG